TEAALDAVALHLDSAGAVIIEPIQGRAGVLVPPAGFLTALADLTRQRGALLIFDEIFTGLGRTGRRFAGEWEGVTPDILCLGKALGGGMPISACLAPRSVMDAWPDSTGEAIHTSTFLGHPLSCAAALGFLDVLEGEQLEARSLALGEQALDYLKEELQSEGAEVRGRGLMIGIELPQKGSATEISALALAEGLIVLPAGEDGRVIELTPPATISEDQLRMGLDTLVRQIRSAS
ncbi:MAG: aminotransferase class III-fold pyridoxal phosphate-dependent enzyme, partial [Longimicrobiales bacterium]